MTIGPYFNRLMRVLCETEGSRRLKGIAECQGSTACCTLR